MQKKADTTGRFKTGNNASSCFCDCGASCGSLTVNDHKNAVNAIHNNIMGNIEISTISSNAPILNTPTIKPIEPHLRTFP